MVDLCFLDFAVRFVDDDQLGSLCQKDGSGYFGDDRIRTISSRN
jgi:hypothetical protein